MSRQSKLGLLVALIVVISLIAGGRLMSGGALSEAARPGSLAPLPGTFAVQYSAPFICGWLPPVPPQDDQHAKPGDYGTAINIHNPTAAPLNGSRQVAIHYRMGQAAPPVPPAASFGVARRRVLQIDCGDIWSMAGLPSGTFVKGAVHIGLPQQLPVAAIYSSQTHTDPLAGPTPGAGISIDVEHILPFATASPA